MGYSKQVARARRYGDQPRRALKPLVTTERIAVEYVDMRDKEDQFIRYFIQFGAGIGLPKSVAQVLGYLLVCNPHQQSALQIQERLSLSTGSTSRALHMLSSAQIIEKVRLPNDRKHYYQMKKDGLEQSVRSRMAGMRSAQQVAEFGLTLDANNQRLLAMRDLYGYLDEQFRTILQKMDEDFTH